MLGKCLLKCLKNRKDNCLRDEYMHVIGLGLANVDYLIKVSKFPEPSEVLPIISFKRKGGGSASNTLVGLARLGKQTGFIGRVGKDEDGDFFLSDLKKEGLDTSKIKITSEVPTPLNYIIVDKKGERTMFYFPERAKKGFGVEDLDEKYLKDTEILHVTAAFGVGVLEGAISIAKKNNIKISVSLGERFSLGWPGLKNIVRGADYIFINERELENFLKASNFDLYYFKTKVKNIILTKASKGCAIINEKETIEVPAEKVENVLDTTGAGDSFAAGFLYGVLEGKSLEECGKLGNKCAALNIQKLGAREGMPSLSEI